MPLSSYRRPYERRTGAVRPLWVFASSLAFHTGGMAFDPDSKRSTNDGLASAVTAPTTDQTFEEVVLPHLDAAYRLARWLMRDDPDAEDVVQEASLRAFRYFRTFVGGNGRAWFLRIVRNTCAGWRGRSFQASTDPFDEEQHSNTQPAPNPETLLLQADGLRLLERAMSNLPDRFRELLVLRELEGLSYRELGEVIGIPTGTVMSGLSRARQALGRALNNELRQAGAPTNTPSREEADAVLV
jgi:RNA polymerase sigma-70 factor, ECF subfamily